MCLYFTDTPKNIKTHRMTHSACLTCYALPYQCLSFGGVSCGVLMCAHRGQGWQVGEQHMATCHGTQPHGALRPAQLWHCQGSGLVLEQSPTFFKGDTSFPCMHGSSICEGLCLHGGRAVTLGHSPEVCNDLGADLTGCAARAQLSF